MVKMNKLVKFHNVWGDDISIREARKDNTELSVRGFKTPSVDKSDIIVISDKNRSQYYRIKSIENCDNPRDLFFAELDFIGGSDKSEEITYEDIMDYMEKYKPNLINNS
jgi:hypothetical protein